MARVGLIAMGVFVLAIQAFGYDYQARYKADDAFTKLTDSKGNGDARLYGTRNFRVVLHGVLYRGGANNHAHRTNPRDNRNPLQEDGLDNLCKEGFGTAIYTYERGFETAVRQRRCSSVRSEMNNLGYVHLSPIDEMSRYEILKLIHRAAEDTREGPVYVHCWNGWHSSGFTAAVALMQFCGLTGDQAAAYWEGTLEGTAENYQGVLKRIRAFQPFPEFKISAERQKQICPVLVKPTPRKKI